LRAFSHHAQPGRERNRYCVCLNAASMPAHASSHLSNASTAWSVHRFSQPSDSSFMHTIYFQQYISCTLNWLQHLFPFHSYAWWHGQHNFVDLPLANTVLLTLWYTHSFTPRHTNKRWLPVNHITTNFKCADGNTGLLPHSHCTASWIQPLSYTHTASACQSLQHSFTPGPCL